MRPTRWMTVEASDPVASEIALLACDETKPPSRMLCRVARKPRWSPEMETHPSLGGPSDIRVDRERPRTTWTVRVCRRMAKSQFRLTCRVLRLRAPTQRLERRCARSHLLGSRI